MIWIPRLESAVPNQPWAPKSSTNTRPEITGETANGRSIKESSRFRPRKLNFAMTQDAARPKMRLATRVTAAVVTVSRKADIASGTEMLVT
jgi:hypothetical protein